MLEETNAIDFSLLDIRFTLYKTIKASGVSESHEEASDEIESLTLATTENLPIITHRIMLKKTDAMNLVLFDITIVLWETRRAS
jgi:hypothetical protein